jgi:DNA-binding MarR family transcriptional regulator
MVLTILYNLTKQFLKAYIFVILYFTSMSPQVIGLTGKELAKILARRFVIFDELYPDKEYTLTELAERTKLDVGNLSTYLTVLEDNGLIETKEKERQRGRPFRYARLTEKAQKLAAPFKQVTQAVGTVEPDEWKIDELVKAIRESGLGENLRKLAANEFFKLCQEDIVFMTSKEKVKRLFEEVVTNPTVYNGEIGELLRVSVSSFFNQLGANKETRHWVVTELYPHFARHLENKGEKDEIRVWAAKHVGNIAKASVDLAKKKEAEDKLFEVYFAEDTKPESLLYEELKQQLVWLASKRLFERVEEKAKSQDKREEARAGMILEGMIKGFSYNPRRVREI